MKLESALFKNRFRLLHVTPVVDSALLLLIFFMISTSFIQRSGVHIALPKSSFHLAPLPYAPIVTIRSEFPLQLFLNEDPIDLEKLTARLENMAQQHDTKSPLKKSIILRADASISFGSIMKISTLILSKDLHLAYASKPTGKEKTIEKK